ncbi:MAG TPA: hypothetical protein VIX91_21465 [Candidatus Acidoferrum sp.]
MRRKIRRENIKVLLDESFVVPASDMRSRWLHMNEDERIDFASNFWVKEKWSANDTNLLEIVMQDGNDRIWRSCALAFLKHPDRDRICSFLIKRVEENTEDEPLNYIQALGLAKDKRATPAIKPYFDKYRKAVEREKEIGVPDDVFFGPISPITPIWQPQVHSCKSKGHLNMKGQSEAYSTTHTSKFVGGQSMRCEAAHLEVLDFNRVIGNMAERTASPLRQITTTLLLHLGVLGRLAVGRERETGVSISR